MKLKKIVIAIIALTVLGCSNNQIVKNGVYTTENITYNVLTNKPVNGVVVKEFNGYKEYYTYKKGKLKNYKSVDQNDSLIVEKSYDSMGLLNGKVRDREDYTIYRHGILSGEKQSKNYGNSRQSYKDGVLFGEFEENGKVKYYKNGVESKDLSKEVNSFETKIKWGTKLDVTNYTGEIYSEPTLKDLIPDYTATLEVRGYDKGALKYAKYYDAEGFKIKEYAFYEGNTDKISKTLEFRDGYLIKSSEYNLHGELDGVTMERDWEILKVKNYINGILQGKTTESFLFDKAPEEHKLYTTGSYSLGLFSGDRNGMHYVDGIQIYGKNDLKENIQNLKIEDQVIGDEFSGLVKRTENNSILIDQYIQGKIKKTYFFTRENLDKIIIFIENGKFLEETYSNGILTSRYTYDSKGVKNGPVLLVEHEDSRTEGNIVMEKMNGEVKHYHGNKVYYVDNYKDGYHHRTIYYDYENDKIENTSSSVLNEQTNQWVLVGEGHSYYKSGSIKAKANYGKSVSRDKNVKYVEYYENGVIKSKYTQDYHAWKLVGEKINFNENGTMTEKLVYSEKGYPVNKKEFNDKGKLVKETTYDGYGRISETKTNFN